LCLVQNNSKRGDIYKAPKNNTSSARMARRDVNVYSRKTQIVYSTKTQIDPKRQTSTQNCEQNNATIAN